MKQIPDVKFPISASAEKSRWVEMVTVGVTRGDDEERSSVEGRSVSQNGGCFEGREGCWTMARNGDERVADGVIARDER